LLFFCIFSVFERRKNEEFSSKMNGDKRNKRKKKRRERTEKKIREWWGLNEKFYVYLGFTTQVTFSQSKKMFKSKKKENSATKKERKVRELLVLRMRNELSKRLFFPHTQKFSFSFYSKRKFVIGNLDLRGSGKRRTRKYRYERGQIE